MYLNRYLCNKFKKKVINAAPWKWFLHVFAYKISSTISRNGKTLNLYSKLMMTGKIKLKYIKNYLLTVNILTYITHTWNKDIGTGKDKYFKLFRSCLEQKSSCRIACLCIHLKVLQNQLDHSPLFTSVVMQGSVASSRFISSCIQSIKKKMVKFFLSNRSNKFVVGGIAFSINVEVIQGSKISPTHFLININFLIKLTSNTIHC